VIPLLGGITSGPC